MTAQFVYLRPDFSISDWYRAVAGGDTSIRTVRVRVFGMARLHLLFASYAGEAESLRASDSNSLFLSDIPPDQYIDEQRACKVAAGLFAAGRAMLGFVSDDGAEIELPVILVQKAKLVFGSDFLETAEAHYRTVLTEAQALARTSFAEGWAAAHDYLGHPAASEVAAEAHDDIARHRDITVH